MIPRCITDDTVYRLKKDVFCENGMFTKGTLVMLKYIDENCLKIISYGDSDNVDYYNPQEIVNYKTFIEVFEFDDEKSSAMREMLTKMRKKDVVYNILIVVLVFIILAVIVWVGLFT